MARDAFLVCSTSICAIAGGGITCLALAAVSINLTGSQAGLAYTLVVAVITGRAGALAVVLTGSLGILGYTLIVLAPRALITIEPGVAEVVVVALDAISAS